MADLTGFRNYAVIGSDETDGELNLYLEAAMAYADNAGVPEPDYDNPLYDLLVYRIATFYHDNKGFPDGGIDASYLGINGMIIQLGGSGYGQS